MITLNGTTGITNDGGYTGDGVVFADTTPANTLVTTTGGNVGIGTSSPNNKLGVMSAAASTGITLATNGNYTNAAYVTNDTTYIKLGSTIGSTGDKFRVALAAPDNAATIDSSGNLLVGTTSAAGRGTFAQTATNQNVVGVSSPASFTGAQFYSNSFSAASTSWFHLYGVSGNNTVQNIIIFGNGNIQNANNSYGSLSDIKLKENITDATPKLKKLCQVRVVNYNLKGDYEQHKQIGVIAQELEQIFPGMVEELPDRDKDGNDLGTTTKSVKYSVFVPMLIKAIQEQQAIITALTARVEALEGTQP